MAFATVCTSPYDTRSKIVWHPIGTLNAEAQHLRKPTATGFAGLLRGVSDRTRTGDHLDHNHRVSGRPQCASFPREETQLHCPPHELCPYCAPHGDLQSPRAAALPFSRRKKPPHMRGFLSVGATGFEPATFRPPAECAIRVQGLRPELPQGRHCARPRARPTRRET
jgi:hypothetical protein